MGTFTDDLVYDKANTFFNTDEWAKSGSGYAPKSDVAVAFSYVERDLPDTDELERREVWCDSNLSSVEKGWRIVTADTKEWRVVSTTKDERGKVLAELARPLSED